MGHVHLGVLPKTLAWAGVVERLRTGASERELAAATLEATNDGLRAAPQDAGFTRAVSLLMQLPLAARDREFESALKALDVIVSPQPNAVELMAATGRAVDRAMWNAGGRTDLGSMGKAALLEVLARALRESGRDLIESRPTDLARDLGAFATTKRMGELTREFMAAATYRFLMFFLSRELPSHIGGARRFANLDEHAEFRDALRTHCIETARIVEAFGGSWFSKQLWKSGDIPQPEVKKFTGHAMKKLRDEFARGVA